MMQEKRNQIIAGSIIFVVGIVIGLILSMLIFSVKQGSNKDTEAGAGTQFIAGVTKGKSENSSGETAVQRRKDLEEKYKEERLAQEKNRWDRSLSASQKASEKQALAAQQEQEATSQSADSADKKTGNNKNATRSGGANAAGGNSGAGASNGAGTTPPSGASAAPSASGNTPSAGTSNGSGQSAAPSALAAQPTTPSTPTPQPSAPAATDAGASDGEDMEWSDDYL